MITYIPGYYYNNKPLPTYAGNLSTYYNFMCPGLNSNALGNLNNVQYVNLPINPWTAPNVTKIFTDIFGQNNIYNLNYLSNQFGS
jgi:hypothetical protein